MTNPMQHRSWILGIRGRAAGAALALAVVLVSAVITAQVAQAQTLTTLHSFDGTDGAYPYAGLVQASNGNLYGTTQVGGIYHFCESAGDGTVFKITPSGTLTTLHSFNCFDGSLPYAGLVQASNGNFYGTTEAGGNGLGTVFKITPSGTLTTLYSFCSQGTCPDGERPGAGLVQATNGDLYGTTGLGSYPDEGTVFKITPSGTLTTLHSINCTDGYPVRHALSAKRGLPPLGFALATGINDSTSSHNRSGKSSTAIGEPPVRRDVPTLSRVAGGMWFC